jgi:hypothetical protein
MTHDDVKKSPRRPARPAPPWSSEPGEFVIAIAMPGVNNPFSFHAHSMSEAIKLAGQHFHDWKDDAPLLVRRSDRSEMYRGPLR